MSLDDGHNEQGCVAAGATPRAASASRRSRMEMFVAAMAAMRRARHSHSSSPSLRALRVEVPRGFGEADDDDVRALAHRGL